MLNKWTVSDDDNFGWWTLDFPKLKLSDLELLVQEIIKITVEKHICRPLAVNDFNPIKQSYENYVLSKAKEKSTVDFFRTYNPASLISYFDNHGEIIEEESANIKEVVEKVGLGIKLDRYPIPPVNFWGAYLKTGTSTNSESIVGLYITVKLKTDIWFPKVIGHTDLDEWYSMSEQNKLRHFIHSSAFNNELASRHTLRLNQFLQNLKKLSFRWNGKWRLEDPTDVPIWYQPYLTESGIKLTLDKE